MSGMRIDQGEAETTGKPSDLAFYRSPEPINATDAETRIIESDSELYQRVLSRLSEPGEWVEAEESLADLEQAD